MVNRMLMAKLKP